MLYSCSGENEGALARSEANERLLEAALSRHAVNHLPIVDWPSARKRSLRNAKSSCDLWTALGLVLLSRRQRWEHCIQDVLTSEQQFLSGIYSALVSAEERKSVLCTPASSVCIEAMQVRKFSSALIEEEEEEGSHRNEQQFACR